MAVGEELGFQHIVHDIRSLVAFLSSSGPTTDPVLENACVDPNKHTDTETVPRPVIVPISLNSIDFASLLATKIITNLI